MFGYVRISKPELKVKEYETYKAVYCSLCKYLGKKYGIFSRFTLSYDFTFLAMLNMALGGEKHEFVKGRCAFNPIKKCNYCKGEEGFKMPAAAAMIMLYYKLLDDAQDEKGIKKLAFKAARLFFSGVHKKAAREFPFLEEIIKGYIDNQSALEKENCMELDRAAHPTAEAMGKILSLCAEGENERRVLERLGYCIGRYVYILDAACDIDEDIKNNSYNPLKSLEGYENEHIYSRLYTCINEAGLAFELLDIKCFKTILGNIIYLGLEETFKKELAK